MHIEMGRAKRRNAKFFIPEALHEKVEARSLLQVKFFVIHRFIL